MRFEHYADEELAAKAQQGDTDAAEALVSRYARTCLLEAKASRQKRFDEETREGECRLALTKAIRSYKTGQGTKFSSYAKMCMRNAMADMARMEGRRIEEVSIQTGVDEGLTIEDVCASNINVEDEAAEALLWRRFNDVLTDLQSAKKSVRLLAGKICDEIDHDGWSLFEGQHSLFDVKKDDLREQLATKLKDFALATIKLRQEGCETSEIASALLVSAECVGLVTKLMVAIFAGSDLSREAKPEKPILILVTTDEPLEGLFAA